MASWTAVVSISVLICWFVWVVDTKLDMGCKCGYRAIGPNTEKDCNKSAKLLEGPEK